MIALRRTRLLLLGLTILAMVGLSLHMPSEAGSGSADATAAQAASPHESGHDGSGDHHETSCPEADCASMSGHCFSALVARPGPDAVSCSVSPAVLFPASAAGSGLSIEAETPPPRA